jgi:hypothetical protein
MKYIAPEMKMEMLYVEEIMASAEQGSNKGDTPDDEF